MEQLLRRYGVDVLLFPLLSSLLMCSQQGVGERWGHRMSVCVCGGGGLSLEATCPDPAIWNGDQSCGPFNWRLAAVPDLSFVVLTARSSLPRTLWALYTRQARLMGGGKVTGWGGSGGGGGGRGSTSHRLMTAEIY